MPRCLIISAIVVALWLLSGSVRPQAVAQSTDEESLFSLGEVMEQVAGRFTPERWW